MANYFGTDCTAGGLGFQMRSFKANAKAQRQAFESGLDPKDLEIGVKGTCTFDCLHVCESSGIFTYVEFRKSKRLFGLA